MKKGLMMLIVGLVVTANVASAEEFVIDASHSTIGFAVKHLSVGTTRGAFDDYTGAINFNKDNFDEFEADVKINAASINTKNEGRDKHLRSDDFLGVEQYPEITFTNARLEKRGEGQVIIGDLTIRDVTKTVTIPVSLAGPVQSPFGATVIGITGQTMINRQDFGVKWSKNLDSGGLVVDDMVTLIVEIEAQNKS